MSGLFITLEGTEGVGKSTQLQLLATTLRNNGHEVVTTREPGGSVGAEQIRRLLVEGEVNKWDGMTEALLNFAARRNHIQTLIKPALAEGKIVISDRFYDSTIAYQAFGYGVDLAKIQQLLHLAIDDFQPDLTLLLQMPVAVALARAKGRGEQNRYEAMQLEFHQRVADGFAWVAAHYPQRVQTIAVESLSTEEVSQQLWQAVLTKLQTQQ